MRCVTKKHVKRVFFQDWARYVRNVKRVAKTVKYGKKGVLSTLELTCLGSDLGMK